MKLFNSLAAGVFLALATAASANAFVAGGSDRIVAGVDARPLVSEKLVYGEPPPILLAQAPADNAIRVDELTEQVRRLNGKVEELTFQLLQLQEQIRKMQEDNEFRFQDLEEKHSDAGDQRNPSVAEDQRLGKPQPSDDLPQGNSSDGDTLSRTAEALGAAPRNLGTLRFDAQGNVIEGAVGKPLDLTDPSGPAVSQFRDGVGIDTTNMEPGLLLARGRDYFDKGDYVLAEKNLREFIAAYPEDKNRPEVQYWLGRSLFANGDFHGAATVFLDTHNSYPDAMRAPDTMLQLGLSMAGLNQREIACATYAEVLKQFPNANENIKSQVAVERASARC